jgi:hypothetical protein
VDMVLKASDLTEEEEFELLFEPLILKAKGSCRHFIREYVKIEDRDAANRGEEIATSFILWPGQLVALACFMIERLSVVLKARQLGLTWLTLAYALWRMLFNPGYSVVALSKREEDAKELSRRMAFMLKYLPYWMTQEKKSAKEGFSGPTWEATTMTIKIHHPGSEPSQFRAETSGPESGRSFTANLIILDEWAFQQFAQEIWTAAYPTVNRTTGGQVIGLSTNKRGSLFEKICQEAIRLVNNFKMIFLDVWTDPRRTHDWYEQTKIDVPDSWMQEYPETIEQAFSAGEGTAFPEFSVDVHVVETFTPPTWWKKWMGHDPGHDNPFAWHWFAVDGDGTVYVYREYARPLGAPKVFYSDQAAEVTEMSRYFDEDEQAERFENIDYIVTGKDAFNKSRETSKTYIDYYRDGGLTFAGFIPAITDRKKRKAVWHEYLKPIPDPENEGRKIAKLRIMDCCKQLIHTLPQLVKEKLDNEKVEDNPEIDNCYDGAGYSLISYHVRQSKAPPQEKSTVEAIKDRLIKQNQRRKRHA